MLINCTLDELKVPGFSGFIPEFGTKKADGTSITSREHNTNIMMPFTRQRPFIVTENSTTSELQSHCLFSAQADGITLTLGAGSFSGCKAWIINTSGGAVTVTYMDGGAKTRVLAAGGMLKLYWAGSGWKESCVETLTDQVEGYGRNLFNVFGITSGTQAQKMAACMAEIRRRCNNNGEIDASGIPDFRGIEIGDYIDGMDLSAIPAENGGEGGQAWNDTYKNNQIMVSGFNSYKGSGDAEVTQNHIVFTFRHCICRKRMNATNITTGGYHASEMRVFMDGSNGDGTGSLTGVTTAAVYNAVKAELAGGSGINYILPIRKLLGNADNDWAWRTYSVFLPSEVEVFGCACVGHQTYGEGVKVHLPIYQKGSVYWVKRRNGARDWWWLSTIASLSSAWFAAVGGYCAAHSGDAGAVGGCAPVFCVA